MSKQSTSLWRMMMALGAVTVIAGAILAWVYSMTSEPIRDAQLRARRDAIAAVSPQFDNSPQPVAITPEGEEVPVELFPLTLGGKPVGAAVETYSDAGFSDRIRLMVGFDSDGKITGYQVLSHSETPGLGAKMDTWFRDPKGNRSVIGRSPASDDMRVSNDGGSVDAITAATITSRAFLDALNRAHSCYISYTNSR